MTAILLLQLVGIIAAAVCAPTAVMWCWSLLAPSHRIAMNALWLRMMPPFLCWTCFIAACIVSATTYQKHWRSHCMRRTAENIVRHVNACAANSDVEFIKQYPTRFTLFDAEWGLLGTLGRIKFHDSRDPVFTSDLGTPGDEVSLHLAAYGSIISRGLTRVCRLNLAAPGWCDNFDEVVRDIRALFEESDPNFYERPPLK
jgi:hypothetical protein